MPVKYKQVLPLLTLRPRSGGTGRTLYRDTLKKQKPSCGRFLFRDYLQCRTYENSESCERGGGPAGARAEGKVRGLAGKKLPDRISRKAKIRFEIPSEKKKGRGGGLGVGGLAINCFGGASGVAL